MQFPQAIHWLRPSWLSEGHRGHAMEVPILSPQIRAPQKPDLAPSSGVLYVPHGPPGTEFLDAETGRKKSPPETANAHRDQEPGMRPAKIPAETAYFRLTTVGAVWEDWMVVCAVICEPVSPA